jgi:hypothetical protein
MGTLDARQRCSRKPASPPLRSPGSASRVALLLRSWRPRGRGATALVFDWPSRRLWVVFEALAPGRQRLWRGAAPPPAWAASAAVQEEAEAAAAAAAGGGDACESAGPDMAAGDGKAAEGGAGGAPDGEGDGGEGSEDDDEERTEYETVR